MSRFCKLLLALTVLSGAARADGLPLSVHLYGFLNGEIEYARGERDRDRQCGERRDRVRVQDLLHSGKRRERVRDPDREHDDDPEPHVEGADPVERESAPDASRGRRP